MALIEKRDDGYAIGDLVVEHDPDELWLPWRVLRESGDVIGAFVDVIEALRYMQAVKTTYTTASWSQEAIRIALNERDR